MFTYFTYHEKIFKLLKVLSRTTLEIRNAAADLSCGVLTGFFYGSFRILSWFLQCSFTVHSGFFHGSVRVLIGFFHGSYRVLSWFFQCYFRVLLGFSEKTALTLGSKWAKIWSCSTSYWTLVMRMWIDCRKLIKWIWNAECNETMKLCCDSSSETRLNSVKEL